MKSAILLLCFDHMSNEKKSLVFIVGAGASKEAGLPLGSELKNKISEALDIRFDSAGYQRISGDPRIEQAFRLITQGPNGRPGDINPHLYASWKIRDAMSQAASIDNFLDAHRDDPLIIECGKLAIASCILEAESKSMMHIDKSNINNTMNFKSLGETWYGDLFKFIVEGCQRQNVKERLTRIAVITFNYDRCIEAYLHAALRNYYHTSIEETTELLSHLKIHHPYGSIGQLSWPSYHPNIEFGGSPQPQQLVAISKGLKTFTEGTNKAFSDINAIRSLVKSAESLVFMGFGFNKQNLDLLFEPNTLPIKVPGKIFGSALGVSESDCDYIVQEFETKRKYEKKSIKLNRHLSCSNFFKEFGRSLSFN